MVRNGVQAAATTATDTAAAWVPSWPQLRCTEADFVGAGRIPTL